MAAVFDPFEIARQVDILDLIQNKYGLEVSTQGNRLFVSCPRSDGDSSPSLSISPSFNRFHCFHCGDWHGTAIDFVMGVEGYDSPLQALRHLDKLYPQLGIINPEGRKRAEVVGRYYGYTEKMAREDHQRLLASEPYSTWVKTKRGFSQAALDHFNIGVRDFNGVPRLMIPQYTSSGQVAAFVSRQMSPKDKMSRYFAKNVELNPESGMMVKKDEDVTDPIPVFRKGSYLYNLGRIKQNEVCVVEGHLDVVAGWEMGVENMVAHGSNLLTDGQVELLGRFESVTLIPDLDMFDKVIENVKTIRFSFPHLPIMVVDMSSLRGNVDKDVNDALLYLSNVGDVEMFPLMVKCAVPAELWLYGYHVSPVIENKSRAFIALQKVLDVSTLPVTRVALATMAAADLDLPADLLYR